MWLLTKMSLFQIEVLEYNSLPRSWDTSSYKLPIFVHQWWQYVLARFCLQNFPSFFLYPKLPARALPLIRSVFTIRIAIASYVAPMLLISNAEHQAQRQAMPHVAPFNGKLTGITKSHISSPIMLQSSLQACGGGIHSLERHRSEISPIYEFKSNPFIMLHRSD
jgi:hypothetical protein